MQFAAFKVGQAGDIGLGNRFAPHRLIHRRSQGYRCLGRQADGGQQVIAGTLGQAGNKVGRCRGYQQQVCPLGQLDMAHAGFGFRVEQSVMYRVTG